MQMSTV